MSSLTLEGKRVFVAGHNGMVGSACIRRLEAEKVEVLVASRNELDLLNQSAVNEWFKQNKPEVVIVAAAKVGGIHANDTFPADFLYQNLMIEANTIQASFENCIEKLLFLGSSCIYPKFANQPISESSLLAGALEPSNEWYAIAKIAGIKLCQAYKKQFGVNFISAMPSNLYGINDNFHPKNSHVLPAMLQRFHNAAINNHECVTCWGSGNPMREFLFVDDLADACIFLLKNYNEMEHINVGTGIEISIRELANLIAKVTGFEGEIIWDASMPDGTMRKCMDVSQINKLGWSSNTTLEKGLKRTFEWYLETVNSNNSIRNR